MQRNLEQQRQRRRRRRRWRRRRNLRKSPRSQRRSQWNWSSMTSLIPQQMTSLPLKKSNAAIFISVHLVPCCFGSQVFFGSNRSLCVFRLQDLTDRDLAKQEREKTLNSLEAFIFETQVRNRSSLSLSRHSGVAAAAQSRHSWMLTMMFNINDDEINIAVYVPLYPASYKILCICPNHCVNS